MPKPKQPPTHLEARDLFQMQLGQLELTRAREAARASAAEIKLRRAQAVLALTQAALAEARLELTVRPLEEAAAQTLASVEEERRVLAADIGKRYAVDWKTTGFDPDTGLLMPLPGD